MPRIAAFWVAAFCALALQATTQAAAPPPAGIQLTTDYPSLTLPAGQISTIPLLLRNQATPPEALTLSLDGVPKGWKATLLGDGRPVAAAMPGRDETLVIELRLDIPPGDAPAQHTVTVHADGSQHHLSLPIHVALTDHRAGQQPIQPQLQQLTRHDHGGRPTLDLAGRDGLMSAQAQIGSTRSLPMELRNSGTAAAQDIALDGTAPAGWVVRFEPDHLTQLDAGKTAEVQLQITPSAQSQAGDYMIGVRARSGGQSARGELRVSVLTSSLWGVNGVILIVVALLVLIGAIARFGRR